jgi:hypothetical protein
VVLFNHAVGWLHVLAGLSLDEDAEEHLAELVRVLDAAWKQMAERLEEAGDNAKISIEVQPNGRAKLNVEKLHALGEPASLRWLRKRVEKTLPKIDLPDLLFEVHAWTGFLDAFVHLGDGKTRMKDLTTSVVALLVSEACNIGMAPGHQPSTCSLSSIRSTTLTAGRCTSSSPSRSRATSSPATSATVRRAPFHQAYRDGMEDQLGGRSPGCG